MAATKKATAQAEETKATKTTAKKETTAKTTAKKEAAPKAAATAKTTAKKETTAKAPAKRTTKKAAEKVTVYIEFGGVKVAVDDIIKNVKISNGADAKEYTIYVKPEDSKAYYVADGVEKEMDVYFI